LQRLGERDLAMRVVTARPNDPFLFEVCKVVAQRRRRAHSDASAELVQRWTSPARGKFFDPLNYVTLPVRDKLTAFHPAPSKLQSQYMLRTYYVTNLAITFFKLSTRKTLDNASSKL